MEAEAALRSLKQKIANAPKKPIKQNQPKPSGLNQNKASLNNKMNYGMDYDMNYNNNNAQGYKKPSGTKTTINKSKPMGGNLRSGPKMNNNKFGGGFNSGFGGGYGGGFEDNRPLGGGLTEDQLENVNEIVTPCPHCGRKFNEISFPKHVKNCQKVFQKKRKAFNTQKQRFNDSEQASLMKMGQMAEKKNPQLNNKAKGGIPKWKLQSMEFRAICHPEKANKIQKQFGMMNNKMGMGGKNISKSVKTGGYGNMGGYGGFGGGFDSGMGGFGGGMPSSATMDYIHCQYCNRRYNEEAYNKHFNGCKRRAEEAKMREKFVKKPLAKTQIKNSYGKGPINYGMNAKKPMKKK